MYGSPLYFIVDQRLSANPLCTQMLESQERSLGYSVMLLL